jgi:aspartate racemase
MKKIGLVGGMTPESTVDYYKALIDLGRDQLPGDLNNPVILIYSINLSEIVTLQDAGQTEEVAELLAEVLENLRLAGAEIGALTANTPHAYLDQIRVRTSLPLISIIDTTFDRARQLGTRKALLLGTRTTATASMYPERFAEAGMRIVVPDESEQQLIDHSIYKELSIGLVRPETRAGYLEICNRYISEKSVDMIILGCTEIPIVFEEGDVAVPLLNTSQVHAEAIFAEAVLP